MKSSDHMYDLRRSASITCNSFSRYVNVVTCTSFRKLWPSQATATAEEDAAFLSDCLLLVGVLWKLCASLFWLNFRIVFFAVFALGKFDTSFTMAGLLTGWSILLLQSTANLGERKHDLFIADIPFGRKDWSNFLAAVSQPSVLEPKVFLGVVVHPIVDFAEFTLSLSVILFTRLSRTDDRSVGEVGCIASYGFSAIARGGVIAEVLCGLCSGVPLDKHFSGVLWRGIHWCTPSDWSDLIVAWRCKTWLYSF